MKDIYILQFEGLCAWLLKQNCHPAFEFQACTHGGWAVYACYTNGMADYETVIAALDDRSDIISFCKKMVKKIDYNENAKLVIEDTSYPEPEIHTDQFHGI